MSCGFARDLWVGNDSGIKQLPILHCIVPAEWRFRMGQQLHSLGEGQGKWNGQWRDKLSIVWAEGCNVEFVEYLSLHLGLFDTQIPFQGDNLAMIASNISKGHFRIRCCQGCDVCFVLPPGQPHEAWEWHVLRLVYTEGTPTRIPTILLIDSSFFRASLCLNFIHGVRFEPECEWMVANRSRRHRFRSFIKFRWSSILRANKTSFLSNKVAASFAHCSTIYPWTCRNVWIM